MKLYICFPFVGVLLKIIIPKHSLYCIFMVLCFTLQGNVFFCVCRRMSGLFTSRESREAGLYQTQCTIASTHRANKHTFQLYIQSEIYYLYKFSVYIIVVSCILCVYILFNYYYLVIRGLCLRAQHCGRNVCVFICSAGILVRYAYYLNSDAPPPPPSITTSTNPPKKSLQPNILVYSNAGNWFGVSGVRHIHNDIFIIQFNNNNYW